MDIPYKELTLVLKQVKPDQLGADERTILDFFATGYLEQDDKPAEFGPEAPIAELVKGGFDLRIDNKIQRRFAGDATLPRSRYFTVCRQDDGDDGGTLVNELTSYMDPRKCGYAAIFDTTVMSEEGEYFRRYLIPGAAAIFYVVLDSEVFPSPFGHLFGVDRRTNRSQLNAIIPLSITRQTISKVIDLRDPETADWFTHNLTRMKSDATGMPVFPIAGHLDDFARLLPSLMEQKLGGGYGVTQIAGLWLRQLGANALIFPSARCDLSVEALNGEVVDHYGWNLVDYRDAPEPVLKIGFDISTEWAEYPMVSSDILFGESGGQPLVCAGTITHREMEGTRRGSLAVRQLEEQRQCLQLMATWSYFVDQVRSEMDDEDAGRLISLPAEAAVTTSGLLITKVTLGLCNLFVHAALGNEMARQEVFALTKTSEEKGDIVTVRALRRFLAIATRK